MTPPPTTIVIPTVGRSSLHALLDSVRRESAGAVPIVVVDDRGAADETLAQQLPDVTVVRSAGRGPAAARNVGWRTATTPWVSFLDDDVIVEPGWFDGLLRELDEAAADVAGIEGRVRVPVAVDRHLTDWERSTAGLAHARWITADMTYRRAALSAVGGFDERFPRAFREDADLALRVMRGGHRLVEGERTVTHPVRPAGSWVSVRAQAGNADDMLLRRLHGPFWREAVDAPPGRRSRNVATASFAAAAGLLLATGRRRSGLGALAAWAAGTVELAVARIAPGPRDRAEVARMLATSAAIPLAASWHTVRGLWRHRNARPWRGIPELVLFDRDGTLVHDVPYNGDPARVTPVPGAREAVRQLRSRGVRVGVITNQSGVATGRLTQADVGAVNDRVEALLGPFDTWQVCPHARDDGCECRKPQPGMVKAACQDVGVDARRCAVVGDIESDVQAARAAGARGLLVPTHPVDAAAIDSESVVADLDTAVGVLLRGTP